MTLRRLAYKKGDTLIEVMFAVAVFGLAAVGAIALMNRGLGAVQTSLETTMARQEIDAQAEALRFIHDAYLTEPDTKTTGSDGEEIATNNFRNLWKAIVAKAYPASTINQTGEYIGGVVAEDSQFFTRTVENKSDCNSLFTTNTSNGNFGIPTKSFVINPRALNRLTEKDADGNVNILSSTDITEIVTPYNKVVTAATYPRLLYGTNSADDEGSLSDAFIENNALKYKNANSRLDSAEGIWVTAIASNSGLQCYDADGNAEGNIRPDFYDFHVQTCWDSISGNATVISSTVRLFNPDQVNLKKQGMITFDQDVWVDFDRYLEGCGSADHYSCEEISIDTCNANSDKYNCRITEDKAWKHKPYRDDEDVRHSVFETNDDGSGNIIFKGYHSSPMDEGKYADLSGESVVDIKLNAESNGYTGHTNGAFHLSIGRVGDTNITTATINEQGGSIVIGGATQNMRQNFGIWLHYDRGTYTVYAADDTDYANLGDGNIIGTYTDAGDTGDIRIELWYTHGSHGCDLRDAATIKNIVISRPMVNDDGSGGCIKITNTSDENISDNENITPTPTPSPNPEEPTPSPTPAPEDQVEETIVATDGTALQYVDIKFTDSDWTQYGLKEIRRSTMDLPAVSRVASGASIEDGSCIMERKTPTLIHCSFPYGYTYAGGSFTYASGNFVIYLDRDSLTDDTNIGTGYFGTGPVISDFWNYKDLKIDIYFYDNVYLYTWQTLNNEENYARYKISSDSVNTIDANGRYWIIARITGNPGDRHYWADKLEIINQRTNRDPSAYLK